MEGNNNYNYNANNGGLDDKVDFEGAAADNSREQRPKKCPMQLLFLFASAIIALLLFILLLSQGKTDHFFAPLFGVVIILC